MNNHSDYNENVGSVAFYLARKSSGETKKHDFYEVIVITEGVVTLCVNGEKTVLRQGDAVLLCPGVQHALNKYRGIQHTRLLINFDENFARRLSRFLRFYEKLRFDFIRYNGKRQTRATH
jgi:araC-like ligand binding domain